MAFWGIMLLVGRSGKPTSTGGDYFPLHARRSVGGLRKLLSGIHSAEERLARFYASEKGKKSLLVLCPGILKRLATDTQQNNGNCNTNHGHES